MCKVETDGIIQCRIKCPQGKTMFQNVKQKRKGRKLNKPFVGENPFAAVFTN